MQTLLNATDFPAPAGHRARPAAPGLPARVAAALRLLHRVNAPLSWSGWLNVALAGLALAGLALDHRLVTNLPVWMKPLKFALSMVAYTWTLGWLLADLPAGAQRPVRRLSWGVAVAMLTEQAVIFGQAARGTTSHYNVSSPLNGLLFGLMGLGVLANTALVVWAVYLSWRYRPHGAGGYVWGLRLGLLEFLVGSVLGGFMIHAGQHTVGAADGGPGLPALGWSTVAGDLRLAHFLGMHALQALPLLGWVLSRWLPRRAVVLVVAGAVLWAGAVAALLLGALAGKSFFA